MLRSAGFAIIDHPEAGGVHLPPRTGADSRRCACTRREEAGRVIEAVMLWNEPNNLSHWDFEIDPGLDALRGRW